MWRIFLFGILPSSAFAEVSDKAASIEQLLVSAAIVSITAATLILWRVLAGIAATVVALGIASMHYDLVREPFIGAHLIREQGSIYAWVAYGSGAVVYASVVAAWAYRYYRKHGAAA